MGTIFRAKPVTVEAVQWTGQNWRDVWNFAKVNGRPSFIASEIGGTDTCHWLAEVWTGTDWVTCPVGAYVIRDERGQFYPCVADVFHARWEPILNPTTN